MSEQSDERDALQHKPFGLSHPTWGRPDCFYYRTESEARAAIVKTYGERSGHVVVGVILPKATS